MRQHLRKAADVAAADQDTELPSGSFTQRLIPTLSLRVLRRNQWRRPAALICDACLLTQSREPMQSVTVKHPELPMEIPRSDQPRIRRGFIYR
jgi:hypothetical protein